MKGTVDQALNYIADKLTDIDDALTPIIISTSIDASHTYTSSVNGKVYLRKVTIGKLSIITLSGWFRVASDSINLQSSYALFTGIPTDYRPNVDVYFGGAIEPGGTPDAYAYYLDANGNIWQKLGSTIKSGAFSGTFFKTID